MRVQLSEKELRSLVTCIEVLEKRHTLKPEMTKLKKKLIMAAGREGLKCLLEKQKTARLSRKVQSSTGTDSNTGPEADPKYFSDGRPAEWSARSQP